MNKAGQGPAFYALDTAACRRAMRARSGISVVFVYSSGAMALAVAAGRRRDAPPG